MLFEVHQLQVKTHLKYAHKRFICKQFSLIRGRFKHHYIRFISNILHLKEVILK